jgi:signal transduction histidine kinase/ActR/RegA family two-component response regulator
MTNSLAELSMVKPLPNLELLPKDRTILERETMEFRPFGLDEQGHTIRDLSGVSIRAVVVYLEKSIAHERGAAAGSQAVEDLCLMLNGRIRDPVYHVTPEFLRNPWNSYSYEFTVYLYEFCERISGDPCFAFRGGAEKVSPIMQALARPFSLSQIYGMFPYFGNKFTSGSIECRVVEVTNHSATVAMRFTDRTLRQFGAYRRRCARFACQAAQGIMVAMPMKVHGVQPATSTEISCIADDDDWCQWTIRWQEEGSRRLGRRLWNMVSRSHEDSTVVHPPLLALTGEPEHLQTEHEEGRSRAGTPHIVTSPDRGQRKNWLVWGGLLAVVFAIGARLFMSDVGISSIVLAGLFPLLLASMTVNRELHRKSRQREGLIQEQITWVELRHEELRGAYLEQEQMRVELRRKVAQLTALHRAGLLFSSTLDRDRLLQQVLETLTHDLRYDRAMVSSFDPRQGVIEHVRIIGVSPEVQAFARSCQIPVTDPESPEGLVVLQGRSILIEDVQSVQQRFHHLNQQLAAMCGTKALIVVPIKTKDRLWGTLTVDRTREQSLTEDDKDLMTTVANQVAIALDNASAYRQIEEWSRGLEIKVRERTEALEQADRLRAQFLSHVSHELRTPLTSIKGFIQNLLDGLTGPLNEKQQRYLSRMLDNSDRLVRMIEDLLDRTRIETGQLEVHPADMDLEPCLADAVEQLRPLAQAKQQKLELEYPDTRVVVWADHDRLIQAVVNLAQNAIKFTPVEGAITIAVELPSQRMARVLVRDTGPGIPPEYLEKIFDPFFRIQYGQRGAPKGLGLGLSIVKTLVELQGGTVTAGNRPEGGAEVAFTLPIRLAEPSIESEAHERGLNILVVDDDADIRQLLIDRVKAQGNQPYQAVDGYQVLEMIHSKNFDGVILDIGIGQPDGLEVLRQIRARDLSMPVIMITASGSQELAIQAIGMGAQAYLLKPFEGGELQQIMERWFQSGSSVDHSRARKAAEIA